MKKFVTVFVIGSAFALFACNKTEAGDLYRILNADSLVTARRADLLTFMYLNSRGNKSAVRALYNQLNAQGLLVNFQPGAVVKVTYYYDDGTAQFQGSRLIGYIATADLSEYLGKQGQSNWQQVQDDEL
jgi:major membrane immunogen (membrane-anchored lipoprotein)